MPQVLLTLWDAKTNKEIVTWFQYGPEPKKRRKAVPVKQTHFQRFKENIKRLLYEDNS